MPLKSWSPLTPLRAVAFVAAAVLTLAVTTLAVLTLAAPGARAASGILWITPHRGADTDPINLTSAPCPTGTHNLIVRVFGPGFAPSGQNVIGNSPVSLYSPAPGADLSVPLTYTMRDYATNAGIKALKGEYTFTLSCLTTAFARASAMDFTGSIWFTSNTRYHDDGASPPPQSASTAPASAPSVTPGSPNPAANGAAPTSGTGGAGGGAAGGISGGSASRAAAGGSAANRGPEIGAVAAAGAAGLLGAAWWARRRRLATFSDIPDQPDSGQQRETVDGQE